MKLSTEEVEHIALLARVSLAPDEIEQYRDQLSHILENFEALGELDTEGVPPTSHSLDLTNVFRDDVPQPSLDPEQALANAPQRHDEYFRVMAVLED